MAFNNPVPTKLELDGIDKILTTPYIDEDWLEHIKCKLGIIEDDIKTLRNEFLLALPTKIVQACNEPGNNCRKVKKTGKELESIKKISECAQLFLQLGKGSKDKNDKLKDALL